MSKYPMSKYPSKDMVQLLNPKSHRYVLVDREHGRIIKTHPREVMPYKNVPIVSKDNI
jgi:hypothetical protein